MTKTCTKCKTKKAFAEFSKAKTGKFGLRGDCKVCFSEYNKQWKKDNKERVIENSRQYYENNKEKVLVRTKQWKKQNQNKVIDDSRCYYQNNKNKIQARHTKYQKEKLQTDPQFKICHLLRSRISKAIKNNQKSGSAIQDLQCSLEYAISHMVERYNQEFALQDCKLGRIPTPYITVEQLPQLIKRKGLHIDHIIPLSSFNLSNREEFLKACRYTNIRLMWYADNIKKGNKIE